MVCLLYIATLHIFYYVTSHNVKLCLFFSSFTIGCVAKTTRKTTIRQVAIAVKIVAVTIFKNRRLT